MENSNKHPLMYDYPHIRKLLAICITLRIYYKDTYDEILKMVEGNDEEVIIAMSDTLKIVDSTLEDFLKSVNQGVLN